MSDEERSKKQAYLREKIMDPGYDVNEFVNILCEKKGLIKINQ